MKLKLLLLFTTFLFTIDTAISQGKIAVLGKIVNQENVPLFGATIKVLNGTTSTTSLENGIFSIEAKPQDKLVISYIGYKELIKEINGKNEIDVQMSLVDGPAEEVVVIGYSRQKKVNLTGSVSVISGNEITKRPVMNTSVALAGALPGVTVSQFNGTPGAEAQIRIRGLGTLGNNDPLIIVDGVVASIGDVDPYNIESISVLKDAASASIYGSRAAGGVILITSKRGKSGRMQVTYDGSVGVQKPVDLPVYLGAVDFMKLYNEAVINEGGAALYTNAFIDGYNANNQKDSDRYPDVDWLNSTMKNALQQQHNITLNGGTDKLKLLAAVNYMDQDGLVANSNFKRYSLRFNSDYKANDKLSFSFDLNLRQEINKSPNIGYSNVFGQAYRVPPVYADKYSDGSWGPGWVGSNSVAWAEASGVSTGTLNRAFINLQANYSPVKDLHLNLTFAPDFSTTFNNNYASKIDFFDFDTKALRYSSPNKNSLSKSVSNSLTKYFKFQANYSKTINWMNFNILGGAEQTNSRSEGFNAYRELTLFPDLIQLDAYPVLNQNLGGSATEWALRSLYGRANFVFFDKYLLEINSRYDGSSRFSADAKRFGFFPSVSAGWIVTKEKFMQNVSFLNLFKVRASLGTLGNQNIGNYPYISSLSLGQGVFNGNIVSTAAQLTDANKDITWESTSVLNIGFDAAILKNRLNVEFDYYIKKTDDILLTLPIPLTTGLSPAVQNAGKVDNKGWDLNIRYNDKVGKNFNYGITGVLSDVINTVTDLKGTGPYISGFQITNVGLEMNSIYGLQSAGLFQTADDIVKSATQFGALKPGDIKYVDQNKDGIINANDRVVIGSRIPRYTYSLNLFAEYKSFDVTAFFQGVGKWDGYQNGDAQWAFSNAGKVQDTHVGRWSDSKTPEENAKATYPRFFNIRTNNQQNSSYWVEDASFLKLKTVSIGYNFSPKLLAGSPFSTARLYLSGQNVFSWDKIKGFDPEAPLGGANFYPQVSVYVVGVRIGLK